MKRLMMLLAMLAVALMLAAPTAMAQEKGKNKDKGGGKKNKMQEMPKTGGIPVNTAVLGLGAGALLVGGGLLVRKVTR